MIDTALTTYDECHPNCKHIVRECKAMSIKDVAKHYGIAEITVRKSILMELSQCLKSSIELGF